MKLEIDFESYSSVDIRSGGAYRYVDSPDFEVLLIAYSIDGGEVKVFDMVTEAREDPLFDKHNPEHLPTELSAALKCDGCLIYAHNAQFERLCIRISVSEKILTVTRKPALCIIPRMRQEVLFYLPLLHKSADTVQTILPVLRYIIAQQCDTVFIFISEYLTHAPYYRLTAVVSAACMGVHQ